MTILKDILSGMSNNSRNAILKKIKKEIREEHLSMATLEDIEALVDYYERGKTHVKPDVTADIRFMRLAREYSTWSKDPSTSVGAVAIAESNEIVLSQGYNGFPRKIKDDYRLYIKALKYKYMAHAEANMIYNATHNGVSLKNSTVYVYGLCVCNDCATALLQAGVKRIVMCDTKNDPRWNDSFELSKDKFNEARINISFIEMESL